MHWGSRACTARPVKVVARHSRDGQRPAPDTLDVHAPEQRAVRAQDASSRRRRRYPCVDTCLCRVAALVAARAVGVLRCGAHDRQDDRKEEDGRRR